MAILIFGHTEGEGTDGIYVIDQPGTIRKYTPDATLGFISTPEWSTSPFTLSARAVEIDSNGDAIVNTGNGGHGAQVVNGVYRVNKTTGAGAAIGDSYDSIDSNSHERFIVQGNYYYTYRHRITIATGSIDYTFSGMPVNEDIIKAVDPNDGSVYFASPNAYTDIRKYNSSGVLQWTYEGGTPGQWGYTYCMRVGSDGKLYAYGAYSNPYSAKMLRIDSDGNNPLEVTPANQVYGNFDLDANDNIHFIDTSGGRYYRIYSPTTLTQTFSQFLNIGTPSVLALVVSKSLEVTYFVATGASPNNGFYAYNFSGTQLNHAQLTNMQDLAVPA